MPDAGLLATILLLVGLFLLGLEFFIPSFGMILCVAIIALVVSFWSACKAWWGVNPAFFWTYVVMLVAGIPGSLVSAVTLMQKTTLGSRLILKPPVSGQAQTPNPLDELIGKRGTAQTLLTPGGMVTIGSQRLHAESLGMLIEPKTPVIVIGTRANRIVVRPTTAQDDEKISNPQADQLATVNAPEETSPLVPARKSGAESESPRDAENGDRLDFEIPEDYTQSPGT